MARDRDDIETLLAAQDAEMRQLARRLVADPADADDLTQDAWLLAEGRASKSRPVIGWLKRVVRNLSLHLGRSEARRARREHAASRSEALPSAAEAVEGVELRRRLIDAVLWLDEPLRTTLILHAFEGIPPRKIAARIGVPVETVRSRIKRAHALLRERLDADSGDDRWAWLGPVARLGGVPLPAAAAAVGAATTVTGVSLGTFMMGALAMKLKWGLAALVVLLLAGSTWVLFRGRSEDDARSADRVARLPSGEAGLLLANGARPESLAVGSRPALLPPRPFAASADETTQLSGSVVVRVIWKQDETPASDQEVRLVSTGDPDHLNREVVARTDAAGRCRFDGVPLGKVSAYVTPNGWKGGELKAGSIAEMTVEIPEGLAMTGRVVSASGVPVEGAAIWLSDNVSAREGAVVSRSGPNGIFKIQGVSPGDRRYFGATAEGHARSQLHSFNSWLLGVEEVTLVLGAKPATLAVTVTGSDGKPLPGAAVLAGSPGWEGPARDGGPAGTLPPFRLITDRDGVAQLRGVPAGDLSLIVRARHHAISASTVAVIEDGSQKIQVALARGAVVAGEVVDESGAPLGSVFVRGGPRGPWLVPSTITGADGRFRLEGLQPGEISVLASGGYARGEASVTVQAASDEETPIRIVIPRGRVIRGRILDDRGAAVPECSIRLEGMIGGRSDYRGLTAGDDGRFAFPQCEDAEYPLVVIEQNSKIEAVRLEHVRPGPDDVVVRIPDSRRAKSSVEGRILLADGTAFRDARVVLYGASHSGPSVTSESDGRFRIETIPAGSYRMIVLTPPGHQVFENPGLEIAVGETRDVGTIRIATRLVLGLTRDDGKSPDGVFGALYSRFYPGGVRLTSENGTAKSPPIPAGTYDLSIGHGELMPVQRPVEIRAGEETVLDLVLRAGVRQELEFLDEGSDLAGANVHFFVKDATGVVQEARIKRPMRFPIVLAPGSYGVDATSEDGKHVDAAFEVRAGSAGKPFVFRLK